MGESSVCATLDAAAGRRWVTAGRCLRPSATAHGQSPAVVDHGAMESMNKVIRGTYTGHLQGVGRVLGRVTGRCGRPHFHYQR